MKAIVCSLFLAAFCPAVFSQQPDPQLLTEIQKIKAIDNHSHPPRVVGPGEADYDTDALPCDPLEPTEPTTAGRPDNPQVLAAWKALWGYKYDDRTDAHIRELLATKERIRREQGDNYSAWVLDQLGIETELANRVALGRGLAAPRFRWVPFDDALLLPLHNDGVASVSPDRKFFYRREEGVLQRYMKELGVEDLPPTLDEYLLKIVTPALEKQKREGAVAVKFEAAYLRTLRFDFYPKREAEAIYAKYAHSGTPLGSEYIGLQNFLFRYIASEVGRLGLPVHIHTGGGCGSYFDLSGSDPALLESVLNDASLRRTNFVLIHGGAGPYTKKTSYLLMKPNVYADFSEQTWLLSARKLSEVVRDWLEWYPEKVMFGTDLFSEWPIPSEKEYDWEEIGWQTTQNGRLALTIALTGMIEDGEITRARALELARMVLRDNARRLYGW